MAMSTEIETRVLVEDHGSSIGAVTNRALQYYGLGQLESRVSNCGFVVA